MTPFARTINSYLAILIVTIVAGAATLIIVRVANQPDSVLSQIAGATDLSQLP